MWAYPSSAAPEAGRQPAPTGVYINIPLIGRVKQAHIDITAWTLWLIVTIIPTLPLVTPIRYLLVGYFCYSVIANVHKNWPTLLRAWPLALVPLLPILLLPVAFSAGANLRQAAFFIATGLIAVSIATRMPPRQIIVSLFMVEVVVAVLSFAQGNHTSYWYAGIFNQKNLLGTHMFMLFATGLAIMLDREQMKWLRTTALAILPLALYMIYLSRSGTTTIVTLFAAAMFLGYAFVWRPAKAIRHFRTLLTLSIVFLASLGTLIFLNYANVNLMSEVLEALGKDSTMTGRTALWDSAERMMKEKPWGFGAEGFWQEHIGEANALASRYHSSQRFVVFSFHNSYLEMGVAFGYIGMWVLYFVIGWATFCIALNWFRTPCPTSTFFLVIAGSILLRSMVESELASPLTTFSILLFVGALTKHSADTRPSQRSR